MSEGPGVVGIVLVLPSMTATAFAAPWETYARLLIGFTPTLAGDEPALTVAITWLVELMTETVPEPKLTAYTLLVEGFTPIPFGFVPTLTIAVTVSVVPSMTETVFEK